MQRIATATRAVDLFGAGKHGFKDGNLAGGVAPTDFNAAWFNNTQEEIAAVIESAGIALNGATLNQLLLALRSAGVFTTPAKGDLTTKAATTAFVKAAGLQASGVVVVTATGALTAAAHGGATVAVNAAGATTQTLPAANTLNAGDRIELMNINAGVATVQRAGADTIQLNNATGTSLALGAGDTLVLASDGVSKWYAVGGSVQLASAAAFSSAVGASGRARLPGGQIFQWGVLTTSPSADTTVTFPITFPTALRSLTTGINVTGGAVSACIATFSTSQFTVSAYNAATRQAQGVWWTAIGD